MHEFTLQAHGQSMHNADADAAEALAARPTEAQLLCSENVSQELRQTRASHEEKQRMLEILQRVHEADDTEQPATGLPSGDAEGRTSLRMPCPMTLLPGC